MYQQQYNPTIYVQQDSLVENKQVQFIRKNSILQRPNLKVLIPITRRSSSTTTTSSKSPMTPKVPLSDDGYSNFYIKLPNGNWMVRIRDGNRKIIGTLEIDGSTV